MEEIEHIVADINQGNASSVLLHNLHEKLAESRILEIPEEKLAEAQELANTVTPDIVSL